MPCGSSVWRCDWTPLQPSGVPRAWKLLSVPLFRSVYMNTSDLLLCLLKKLRHHRGPGVWKWLWCIESMSQVLGSKSLPFMWQEAEKKACSQKLDALGGVPYSPVLGDASADVTGKDGASWRPGCPASPSFRSPGFHGREKPQGKENLPHQLWSIQITEHYSTLRRKELSSHEKTRRKRKCILLSEKSHFENAASCKVPTLTFWKRQSCGDSKLIGGCQGWGWGAEEWTGRCSGQRKYSTWHHKGGRVSLFYSVQT